MKRTLLSVLLSVVLGTAALFSLACGPSINILKGAVAGFAPFVAYEISQGNITQEDANKYTKDANDLIDDFGILQTDFASAKSGADKAIAIQMFANKVVPIANDFVKIPNLQVAVAVLNTTLAVVEAFYGGGTPKGSPGGSADVPKTERELKAFLDKQGKALSQALTIYHYK